VRRCAPAATVPLASRAEADRSCLLRAHRSRPRAPPRPAGVPLLATWRLKKGKTNVEFFFWKMLEHFEKMSVNIFMKNVENVNETFRKTVESNVSPNKY
jgi:hypothetical protein